MSKSRAVWAIAAVLSLVGVAAAAEMVGGKHVSPQLGKLEELDAVSQLGEPNYGYVGELGSFEATTKDDAEGMMVVHNYPDTSKYALGTTKLDYVGPKRLGNVDGWVFKTQWDGDRYPSRIFFSSEEVYFGGGESAFIASDYRDSTGWVWKLLPLRRTQLVMDSSSQ